VIKLRLEQEYRLTPKGRDFVARWVDARSLEAE
jgi:DNA-binding PadR family transcriptional regulator